MIMKQIVESIKEGRGAGGEGGRHGLSSRPGYLNPTTKGVGEEE